ncbi:MAG: glycosyltransferase family 2 protein [Eubacteriales bacterium]|nr:glycosyltransferase family 2 protein [Eubacteriales bacterium]
MEGNGTEKISIVVPVYNAAAYLGETVEMVKRQTLTDWELILVDDHSADESYRISEELARQDGRIVLLEQEAGQKGAAHARNLGIRRAAGRYLAFLDADDIWKADKLEKQLAFLKEKDAAFSFTAYEFGDEDAVGTGKIVRVPETLTYKKALSRTVIFTSTVLFDLTKIKKELLYMPDIKSEDTAAWWQILRAGYTAYGLNENLVIYRRPKKSLSSNKAVALSRIWNLYRKQEKMSVLQSVWYFCFWAFRATLRRI